VERCNYYLWFFYLLVEKDVTLMVDICDFMRVALTTFVGCLHRAQSHTVLRVTAIDDLEFRRKNDHPRNVKISSRISIYE